MPDGYLNTHKITFTKIDIFETRERHIFKLSIVMILNQKQVRTNIGLADTLIPSSFVCNLNKQNNKSFVY